MTSGLFTELIPENRKYNYVPFSVLDTDSVGRQTREGSRTLEYAFEDFAIRQVAQLLNKSDDLSAYTNRSLWYRNTWDSSVTSDGYTGMLLRATQHLFPIDVFRLGFFQKRLPK
jgi:putative alpha-1,2-mannosidase